MYNIEDNKGPAVKQMLTSPLIHLYGTFPMSAIALAVFVCVSAFSWWAETWLAACILLLFYWQYKLSLSTLYSLCLGLLLCTLLYTLSLYQQEKNKPFIGHQGFSHKIETVALQDSSYHGQRQSLWVSLEKSYGGLVSAQAHGKVKIFIPAGQPRFFRGMRLVLLMPAETQITPDQQFIHAKKVIPQAFDHPLWAFRAMLYIKAADIFTSRFQLRSGLFFALILGDRSALLPTPAYQIKHAGISHLLALSGLHLGILTVVLYFFLSRFLPKKTSYFVILILLFLYLLFVGSPPSLVRAYIATTLGTLFWVKGRVVKPLDILVCVCPLSLFINPDFLFSLSWQLSFLAVLGILLLHNDFARLLSFLPAWLSSSLSIGLAAAVTTTPFVAAYFPEAYPHGIVATIVLMPFLGLWFISGLIAIVLPFLHLASITTDEILWFIIRHFSWMPAWPNIFAILIFSIILPICLYFILWRKDCYAPR